MSSSGLPHSLLGELLPLLFLHPPAFASIEQTLRVDSWDSFFRKSFILNPRQCRKGNLWVAGKDQEVRQKCLDSRLNLPPSLAYCDILDRAPHKTPALHGSLCTPKRQILAVSVVRCLKKNVSFNDHRTSGQKVIFKVNESCY